MITLADLRARNAWPSWQEAVAIVQELFHTTLAARGSAARLPDVEHIALGGDGTVALLAGGSVPENPVRHFAVLLNLLLEDVTAPAELVGVVRRNCADHPEAASVEELANALAYFERPGRRDDIARLVARASLAEEQTRADDELRRLKERAVEAEKPRAQAQALPPPGPPPRNIVLPLAVATIVLGLAVIAGTVWWRAQFTVPPSVVKNQVDAGADETGTSASAATPESQPQSLLARVGSAVRTAAASLTGSSPEPAVDLPPVPPAPKEAAQPMRRRPVRVSASRAAAGAAVPPVDAPPDAVTIIMTELGGRPLDPDPAAAPETGDAVYTSGDLSVLPPTIVRPVIPPPPSPNAPADTIALFDVLVDRQGRVEQVQLASSPSRFHERMILSHVKAWTFQPAMKDGRPVRYRLRILLTV